jgi:hypothetical protein
VPEKRVAEERVLAYGERGTRLRARVRMRFLAC